MNTDKSSKQADSSGMELPAYTVPKPTAEAMALVPKRQAYEAQLLPLRVENRKLICLGRNPVHPDALRRFKTAVCREVEVIMAPTDQVVSGLREAYGPPEYLEVIDLVNAVSNAPKPMKRNRELQQENRRRTMSMKVIAITSGKGGVGKSSITANLAVALANQGFRVGLMDCDFGLSNLHVMFGANPSHTMSDVIARRIDLLSGFEKVRGGVFLLAGPAGAADLADLNYSSLQNADAGFSMVSQAFDFLLLDTAAGIHEGVLSLLMAADEAVLVTTPDPAAILDAYVTARALLDRRPNMVIKCIVNQATTDTQAKLIFGKFMAFLSSNADARAEYVGKVSADRSVVQAARMRVPFTISYPGCSAAKDMDSLATKLSGLSGSEARPERGLWRRILAGRMSA